MRFFKWKKPCKKLVSLTAALSVVMSTVLCFGGQMLFGASADVSGSYEIIQNFEAPAARTNSGVNLTQPAGNGMKPAFADYATGGAAVSGDYSMGVANGYLSQSHELVDVNLRNDLPSPTDTNYKGLFFRYKGNNPAGVSFFVGDGASWGVDLFDSSAPPTTLVWLDGTVVSSHLLPANFDGYVFIEFVENGWNMRSWVAGAGTKLCINMRGDGWNGVQSVFDNVGYYSTADATIPQIAAELIGLDNANYKWESPALQLLEDFENDKAMLTETQWKDFYSYGNTVSAAPANETLAGRTTEKLVTGGSGSDSRFMIARAAEAKWDNIEGVFMRLKTNAPAGSYAGGDDYNGINSLMLTPDNGDPIWGDVCNIGQGRSMQDWFGIHYINKDGTGYGTGPLPANFDGYVFLSIRGYAGWDTGNYAAKQALIGTYNLGIRVVGNDWNGKTTYIDNVGYYKIPGTWSEWSGEMENIAKLAAREYSDQLWSDYEVFQDFDTTTNRNNSGVNTANSDYNSTKVGYTTGTDDVINGASSMKAVVGTVSGAGDRAAVSLVKKAPLSSMGDAQGMFFRINTNVNAGSSARLFFTAEDVYGMGSPWGTVAADITSEMICVPLTGTATKGALPANFDGYVYVPFKFGANDFTGIVKNSKTPVPLSFVGVGPNFGNSISYYDNVGYYYIDSANTADFQTLTNTIMAAYPDKATFDPPPPKNYQMVQTFENGNDGSYAADKTEAASVDFTTTLAQSTNNMAVSGDGSLKVSLDLTAANKYEVPRLIAARNSDHVSVSADPSLSAGGVFLRMIAGNTGGQTLQMFIDDPGSGLPWYQNAAPVPEGKVWTVPANGSSATYGLIPANFNGWIFIPADGNGKVISALFGTASVMFGFRPFNMDGAETPHWDGADIFVDNVGYFDASVTTAAHFTALVAQLKLDGYGDNPSFDPPFINYQMIQTFEAGEDGSYQGNAFYSTSAATQIGGQISAKANNAALSGNGSLRINSQLDATADGLYDHPQMVVQKDSAGYALNAALKPTGVFVRLKAKNSGLSVIELTIADVPAGKMDIPWGNSEIPYGKYWLVPADGSSATEGNIPANFDGWIFIPVNVAKRGLIGNHPVSLGFGRQATLPDGSAAPTLGLTWNDIEIYVDNVGYYNAPEAPTANDFISLVADFHAAGYTDNTGFNPPEPKKYQMVQTFEGGADGSFGSGSNYGGQITISRNTTASTVLSQNASLIATPAADTYDHPYVVAAMNAGSVNVAVNPGFTVSGVFARLKAENSGNQVLGLSLGYNAIGSDVPWGRYSIPYGKFWCVPIDGSTPIHGNIPPNFDGYVFITLEAQQRQYLGNSPIVFDFGGIGMNEDGTSIFATSWDLEKQVSLDNVGYYSMKADASAGDFTALTDSIKADYPERNPLPDIRFTINGTASSFSAMEKSATATVSVASSLGGAPVWTIVSNPGDIAAMTGTGTSRSFIFTGSGLVTVRVAYGSNSRTFTLNVLDTVEMREAITMAKAITKASQPHATDELWDQLQAKIAESEKALLNPGTTQDSLNSNLEALKNAVYKFKAPDPANQIQVFQTYETDAEKANYKLGKNDLLQSNGDATLNLLEGLTALSGNTSLGISPVTVDQYDWVSVVAASSIPAPAADMPLVQGVFFRIKADNLENSTLILSFMEPTKEGQQWMHMVEPLNHRFFYVPSNGSGAVYSSLPENCDGYVFMPINDAVFSDIYNGGAPLSIYFGPFGTGSAEGQRSSWNNTLVFIDNIGYYSSLPFALPPAQANTDNFNVLAQMIKDQYKDNMIPKLYISTEYSALPQESMDVQCGIKAMLTAVVDDSVTNKTINWSVVTGSATFQKLDVGSTAQIAARTKHNALFAFQDSGKTVIRASVASLPNIYVDFTFNVLADRVPLDEAVLEARSQTVSGSPEAVERFRSALDNAIKLLDRDEAKQSEYDKALKELLEAARALGIILPGDDVKPINLKIDGYVTDRRGYPVTGYTVELHSVIKTCALDKNGYYFFNDVEYGPHIIYIKDKSGKIVAQKEFQLVQGTDIRLEDTVITVPYMMGGISLSFELDGTELSVSQLTLDNIVGVELGDVNGTQNGGTVPSTGSNRMDLYVCLMVLCGGAFVLMTVSGKNKKSRGRS